MSSEVVLKMIQYFSTDVRRINHALKVYSFAKTMGESMELTQEQQFILEASAILHDIGIKEAERKYNSSSGHYQELEGPAVAKELLSSFKLDDALEERICFLIGHHHSYQKIDDIVFQILVEADFLVNIYEDEMNEKQTKSIYDKYIKTRIGKVLIENCYMNN